MLGVRVALAGQGWAVEVDRLPRPDDPELVAVLRPVARALEAGLAPLAAVAAGGPLGRRTTRARVPSPTLLSHLGRVAALEGAVLVPITSDDGRRAVEEFDREAGSVLGHASGAATGAGERADRDVFLLLATEADDELAALRSGEALERVLLELAHRGWTASVVPSALAVPLVRAEARSALCWDDHPQALIRIG